MKPRLLDLFCGAGGASVGYHRAGFDVVGVDIKPHKDYPFEFVQADALDFCAWARGFDAFHASPPCQHFTRAGHLRTAQGKTARVDAPDLVAPTRELLEVTGLPYVIENVPGAPIRPDLVLCGSSFGLRVRRHRWFESNVELGLAPPCDHAGQGKPVGVYGSMRDEIPHGGHTAKSLEEARDAMGIDWMRWGDLVEAIPPAFTEFIGERLIAFLSASKEKESSDVSLGCL